MVSRWVTGSHVDHPNLGPGSTRKAPRADPDRYRCSQLARGEDPTLVGLALGR